MAFSAGQLADGHRLEFLVTKHPGYSLQPFPLAQGEFANSLRQRLREFLDQWEPLGTDILVAAECHAQKTPRPVGSEFDDFASLLDALREQPELVNEVDQSHRDALVRLLVESTSCLISPAKCGADITWWANPLHATPIVGPVNRDLKFKNIASTNALLGGKHALKRLPETRTELHAAFVEGVPYTLLIFLTDHAIALKPEEIADVVGISSRTLRRQKSDPKKLMPADLASKTWMFAETLAKASDVMGGREAAERWMSAPAMGLDGARPIDLLRTLQGAELVNEFLERLEYGVYN